MTSPAAIRRYLSPSDVAEDLGIDIRTVLRWIKSGELAACNVVAHVGKKPRWRIAAADLDLFLARRSSAPTPPAPRRRRKDPAVKEYF